MGHAAIQRRGQARANHLKCITRMKLRVFVLNVFYGRNAITRADLPYGAVPEAPRSDVETFFGLRLYFAGRSFQNLQTVRGSVQCKSGPGNNMVSKRNHLLYHFSIGIIYLLPISFLRG